MDYLSRCEALLQGWYLFGTELPDPLRSILDTTYLPEPWMSFGDQARPLVFLTTNPGNGMPHQHRDAIAAGESPVKVGDSCAAVAETLGLWYQEHLTGPARRRIGAMLRLAPRASFSGIMQVESIPFHSRVLPKKKSLPRQIASCPVLRDYTDSLRGFLADRTVIALSAASSQGVLGQETIRNSLWLTWQCQLMGMDLGRCKVTGLVEKAGRATCVAVAEHRSDATKAMVLMMGGNHLPGPGGLERLANVLMR